MEPTNPTPTPAAPPVVPPTPTSTLPNQDSIPPVNQQAQTIVQEKKGGPSLLVWVILGVVILAAAGGGAYWWMTRPAPQEETLNTSVPTETVTPTVQANLNEELSQITVPETTDEDFTALDEDLKNL